MKKLVDGVEVDLTAEELAQRAADEAKHEARQQDLKAKKYARDREKELIALDGEGMDAMRKALTQLYGALDYLAPPEELEEYLNKVDQIKARHPKTEAVQK